MAKLCPICSRPFTSKAALRNHTGATNRELSSAQPWVCRTCNRIFCSQRAMDQHRDAPSHNTMFSCDGCKRTCGSKHDVAQHNASTSHMMLLAQSGGANATKVDTRPGPGRDQAPENPPTTPPSTAKGNRRSRSDTKDEDLDENVSETGGAGDHHAYVDYDQDQDWILCDKDCGWCGHCGDNVDY